MSSGSKILPLKLYGSIHGPNPGKVYVILSELGVPFEVVLTQMSEVKTPAYLEHNPNGRLPTVYDPNTDIKLVSFPLKLSLCPSFTDIYTTIYLVYACKTNLYILELLRSTN